MANDHSVSRVEEANDAPEVRQRPGGLSKNEKLVWEALAANGDPLKAYEILDQFKGKGRSRPNDSLSRA